MKPFFTIGLAFCGVLVFGDRAFAWSAGVHIMQGSLILENLLWVGGGLAKILECYPLDYLYGCLSADIFIGKGSRYHHDHCHNWSIAKRMLSASRSDRQTAFAYGYLSHLAADIVAHNVYVPNQLYLTSSTARLGHIYWEVRAEEYTDRRYWKIAEGLMLRGNHENDTFVQKIVKQNIVPFETKKKIFLNAIRLCDLGKRRRADTVVSRNSRWDVTREYIDTLNHICLGLIVNFLNNPDDAVCLKYDPIGSERLSSAKQLRRVSRQLNGRFPNEAIFEIPEDLEMLARVPQGKNSKG